MSYEINGHPICEATIKIPRHGIPRATIVLVEPATLAVGDRVTLTVGDVTMVGTVLRVGTFAARQTVDIVGGAGGWERDVPAQSYADQDGVALAAVAADLASVAGETLGTVPSRILGAAWHRVAGTASSALRDAVGDVWWVGLDGVTNLSARPVATSTAAGSVIVESYDPTTGRAILSAEDDGVSRFLPGARIASDVLPQTITITETILRATTGSVRAEVVSDVHPMVALVASIVAALTRKTVFYGLYIYAVLGDTTDASDGHGTPPGSTPGGTVSLRNVSGVAGIPDMLSATKAHGIPGAYDTLAAGTLALVGFQEGDPSQPYVALYLPGQPLASKVGIDSADTISLGAYTAAVPLARAGIVDANQGIIVAKPNTVCAALSIPPLGGLNSTATTKVRGE